MAEKPDAEKLSHATVGYQAISTHTDEFCAGCEHYIPASNSSDPRCEGVKSPISPRGWCRRFDPK